MIRAVFLSVLSGLCALGIGATAGAVGEDVFVVPRVSVQASASSATAAKAAAQTEGRRRAMNILLRRLTVEEDWQYLPRFDEPEVPVDPDAETEGETAAQPAIPDGGVPTADILGLESISPYGVPQDPLLAEPSIEDTFAAAGRRAITLTNRDLELLESGFEVYDEKSSSRTYRALITYRFKPSSVRKLLKDALIPYSEAQTRTALVLPVLQTANGLYLWEENNPWLAAWKVRPFNNELTPLIAPLGDLEDAASISAEQALDLDAAALETMALRYGVSQVIVAHAFLQQAEGEDRLRVRLINGVRESGELRPLDTLDDFGFGLEDDLRPPISTFESASPLNQGGVGAEAIAAGAGEILAEGRYKQPSGNFPELATASIDAVIARYAKPWKEQTLIDHTAASLLAVSAYYKSMSEWSKIRSALVSTPLVGSVQVLALSRSGAEMVVRGYGDPNKLVIAMEAQGLAFWSNDGEQWQVATPTTAQDVRRTDRRRSQMPASIEDRTASVAGPY
ncbi:MAG: DUF2066 domain-containing protein [Pseudomonadota bacterium]